MDWFNGSRSLETVPNNGVIWRQTGIWTRSRELKAEDALVIAKLSVPFSEWKSRDLGSKLLKYDTSNSMINRELERERQHSGFKLRSRVHEVLDVLDLQTFAGGSVQSIQPYFQFD